MRSLFRILAVLLLLCFTGCSDSSETPQVEPMPVNEPPSFARHEDPKAFIEAYLQDLQGETFLPVYLVDEQRGQTAFEKGIELVAIHQSLAFLEWYYSEAYLAQVRTAVDQQVERMDYQLSVMGLPREGAFNYLLVMEAGPIAQKEALKDGVLQQTWTEHDDNSYALVLSSDNFAQLLRVVKENGLWKLEVVSAQ